MVVAVAGVLRIRPLWALAIGCAGVVIVEGALLAFGRDASRAVPALLLLTPVVVSGLLGGRLVALAVAIVATVGYALQLPPIGSPRVELSEDVLALVTFVGVASLAGVLLSSVVISDQRRLSAEVETVDALRQVDRDRAALLRSVSHDLRTPLATIRAAATDLRSDFPHPAETHDELLDLVIDETERLDRIVGNLLSLSRIEAGALLPERQPVDLGELVDACVHRLRRITGTVDLVLEVEADLPLVPLDYSQMDQVVANLLENAVRHSPAGSTVNVRICRHDSSLRLVVADEGPGIDAAVRDRLFQPFAAATGSGSSGIGLAISKAIVEAHGGTIEAPAGAHPGARLVVEVPIDG